MLRACGIGREPPKFLPTHIFLLSVLSIRPPRSPCSLQDSWVTCCSSVALATPSFCQLRLSGQRRGEAGSSCRPPGCLQQMRRWDRCFSTLPCAGSGQGGLGGHHPVGGGRRQSVGSNDLQREQNRSLSWGPPAQAAQQHHLAGHWAGVEKSPKNTSALKVTFSLH